MIERYWNWENQDVLQSQFPWQCAPHSPGGEWNLVIAGHSYTETLFMAVKIWKSGVTCLPLAQIRYTDLTLGLHDWWVAPIYQSLAVRLEAPPFIKGPKISLHPIPTTFVSQQTPSRTLPSLFTRSSFKTSGVKEYCTHLRFCRPWSFTYPQLCLIGFVTSVLGCFRGVLYSWGVKTKPHMVPKSLIQVFKPWRKILLLSEAGKNIF